MFLSLDEFIDKGGAELDEEVYERLEMKAEMLINRMTFNRVRNENPVREAVKDCVYDLVATFSEVEKMDVQRLGVSSMSNDGVSVTYGNGKTVSEIVRNIAVQIVRDYLTMESVGDIPLLFKGVY